ncbi:type 1 glutamine amidotransferase [Natrarchaeobius oligotrophus]|uniref:Type 1 glutamine amidotransferase n=1 Tax=Natrarchaeobius chitinivorans TaxID=1679083 RepID=A0A3N6MX00_NATCH|nr:type 1 glutamine amidotransferase [Natrarchaeobius chitinivorans]RQH00942.1 type 1 glutamine amidotransferase [Natrarchaeobius chitinivorans]
MSHLRIAVLDATHRDENARRNFRRELAGSLAEFDVTDGSVPDDFAFDAAVVTGSRSSVYWDEAWIESTKAWVSEAIDRDIPFLGVCWGHQLLADVLGGTVEDMGAYEVGYSEIERTADSRLFDGISETFTAFTSHSDAVSELPLGADALARNHYSNHGFRKDRVFGVQFHPEYDTKTARDLVHTKELSDERLESVLAEINRENYRAACEAKLVFGNFLEFVRETTETVAVEAGDATAVGAGSDVATDGSGDDSAATGRSD